MDYPTYPAARLVAPKVATYLAQFSAKATSPEPARVAPLPEEDVIESLVDVAFWTSLRREELFPPRISLAYVSPEQAIPSLRFERLLPLEANALTRIAPGVERQGIHLGVWHFEGKLRVWGATRTLPTLCFVVETVAPGHLVIKHRQDEGSAKFRNIAVLEGDQVKVLSHTFPSAAGCSSILDSLLGENSVSIAGPGPSNLMIRLAVSMRDHRRGGSLLVVPQQSDRWRSSIAHPISYSVSPAYTGLSNLYREVPEEGNERRWRDAFTRAVDAVAGLTAIDGATIITNEYEVVAFGAKIIRPDGSAPPEHVAVIEPLENAERQIIPTGQLGGTRHISAAQFAFANRDAVALVASQDGPFTIFAWSICEEMLYAYRVDTILL